MDDKTALRTKIYELDFALDELNLFLDSHPDNEKAVYLLASYRKMREDCIKQYEEKHGRYIVTVNDVKAEAPFKWIKGPWPWENEFNESNL